jgi:hypothetical protein
MAKRPPEFYEAIRLEYVNGSMSAKELAAKHGLPPRGLEKRVTRYNWSDERRKVALEAANRAQATITDQRAKELADWNTDDVRLARALRSQVARTLHALTQNNRVVGTETLRNLTIAAEATQRIGRLALGASTGKIAFDDSEGLGKLFANAAARLDQRGERGELIDVTPPRLRALG